MENFITTYSVSRETFDLLKLYQESLTEWQGKFNLVSNSTLEDSWNRHFVDSAQLFPLIPETAKTLLDMGSGAGFPGMVLAIMAKDKTPYLKVNLVESVTKKTLYLNHVKSITDCDVKIINKRIEDLVPQKFDVITARAVTSLSDLFAYAFPRMKKNGICLFSKGKSYLDEIAVARQKWYFEYSAVTSITCAEGAILVVRNLNPKGRK